MFKEPTFRVALRLEPILNFNILWGRACQYADRNADSMVNEFES